MSERSEPVLGRRTALKLLAGAGAVALIGCSDGDDAGPATTAGSATAGSKAPDATTSSSVAAGGTRRADGTASTASSSAGSSDTAGSTSDAGETCSEIPEETAGPFPGDGNTGRLWPIFAGERGEYELAAGSTDAARGRLRSIAATANSGRLLPEQVWDTQSPAGSGTGQYAPLGQTPGTGTFSATQLGWTHAQLVRLAWSIDAGRPVEQPAIVACRYAYADACRENSSE